MTCRTRPAEDLSHRALQKPEGLTLRGTHGEGPGRAASTSRALPWPPWERVPRHPSGAKMILVAERCPKHRSLSLIPVCCLKPLSVGVVCYRRHRYSQGGCKASTGRRQGAVCCQSGWRGTVSSREPLYPRRAGADSCSFLTEGGGWGSDGLGLLPMSG